MVWYVRHSSINHSAHANEQQTLRQYHHAPPSPPSTSCSQMERGVAVWTQAHPIECLDPATSPPLPPPSCSQRERGGCVWTCPRPSPAAPPSTSVFLDPTHTLFPLPPCNRDYCYPWYRLWHQSCALPQLVQLAWPHFVCFSFGPIEDFDNGSSFISSIFD